MKKIVSLLLALVLVACAVVPAFALESAKTVVSVSKGDEVTYTLYLSDVPEKVVGCDLSVYYDSSALQVSSYSDFSGSFDEDDHQAIINPNIPGNFICLWSILSGVRFTDRKQVCSIKFKALKDTDTHISYYVRYMYPENMVMFTEYTFTCDVKVNKKVVIENQAPELNIDEPQSDGKFVNSVTGKSEDANVNVAENGVSNNSNNPNTNGGEANENTVSSNTSSKNNGTSNETNAQESEATSVNGGVDAPASVSQTTDKPTTSVWLWIILGVIVASAGCAAYVLISKKKKA